MTVPAITAEWLCSRCGTSNRKLVAVGTTETRDRCNHCGAKHTVKVGPSAVRWVAALE